MQVCLRDIGDEGFLDIYLVMTASGNLEFKIPHGATSLSVASVRSIMGTTRGDGDMSDWHNKVSISHIGTQ